METSRNRIEQPVNRRLGFEAVPINAIIIHGVKKSSEEYGLYLNIKKTKIMIYGRNADQPVKADGEDIEVANTFNFHGSLVVDEGGSSHWIQRRLDMVRTPAFKRDKGISRAAEIIIMDALVFSIATYGSETWAVGMTSEKSKIQDFEMWSSKRCS